jgi:hypothetical protein
VGVLRHIFTHRVTEPSSDLAAMFAEAEPEVVERLNELVDVMKEGGFRPSSSAVLALLTMALALLLKEEYDSQQIMLVVHNLLPFADFVKDHLVSPIENAGEGD